MPQLDKVTFCTQVVWLVVVFLSIYLVLALNFIPRLAFILKYRAKLEIQRDRSLSGLDTENVTIAKNQSTEVTSYTEELRDLYNNLNNQLTTWSNSSIQQIKTEALKSGTKIAIKNQASIPAYQYKKEQILKLFK